MSTNAQLFDQTSRYLAKQARRRGKTAARYVPTKAVESTRRSKLPFAPKKPLHIEPEKILTGAVLTGVDFSKTFAAVANMTERAMMFGNAVASFKGLPFPDMKFGADPPPFFLKQFRAERGEPPAPLAPKPPPAPPAPAAKPADALSSSRTRPVDCFDRFKEWIGKLSFAGFPLPIKVVASSWSNSDVVELVAYMAVKDRRVPIDGDPANWVAKTKPGSYSERYDEMDLNVRGPTFRRREIVSESDLAYAKDQTIRLMRDLVIHELLEFTMVDGVREFDPHTRRPSWQPF